MREKQLVGDRNDRAPYPGLPSCGQPGGHRVSTRSPLGAALRPRLSLSAGRLDRPAHRRRSRTSAATSTAGCWLRRSPPTSAASRPCRVPKRPTEGWKNTRTLINALFVRRYDKEYLEEMKGIADGATAAGARFDDRPIDLVDIVGLNVLARDRDARLRPRSHADRPGRHALPAHPAAGRRRAQADALQRLRRHRRRPPPTARSSSATSPCSASIRRTSTTSGSTSSRRRAIAS